MSQSCTTSARCRGAARLAGVFLLGPLLVSACRSGTSSEDADDGDRWDGAVTVPEGGERCAPAPAPEADAGTPGAPDPPEDVEATFDTAVDATMGLSSARIVDESSVDSAAYRSLSRVEAGMDDSGVFRLASELIQQGDEIPFLMCSDGETVWFHAGEGDGAPDLPAGTRWVEATPREAADQGLRWDLQTALGAVPILRGIRDVEDRGTTEMGGIPVRLLRGDVDYQAALDAASSEEAEALETNVAGGDPEADIVAEAGLDGRGLVRSLHLEIEGQAPSAEVDGTGQFEMTIDLLVQAPDVAIEPPPAPPAGETVPISEVPR